MRFWLIAVFALSALHALAQPATPAQREGVAQKSEYGTLHLRCGVGSFKSIGAEIIDANQKRVYKAAEGRFEVSFSGTVMVNMIEGRVVTSGDVKKEFDKYGRQAYFGTGKIVIYGKWRAVQWFGRDMTAVLYGNAILRLSGEFDRNLDTGQYWYDDPTNKRPWYATGTVNIVVPAQDWSGERPVERRLGGGTGKG